MDTSLLDPEGFVSLVALREAAERLEPARFLNTYSAPALLVTPVDSSMDSEDDAEAPARSLLTLNAGSTKALRYINRCGFVVKRPGNPFPRMISVGRATNSDLVISVDSVSKFHGYFERSGEDWTFADQNSTNGTTHNGKRIAPGEKVLLKDGDLLVFGLEVQGLYLLPSSLHAYLLQK